MEKWLESERLYEGRIVSLRVGDVRMDDGSVAYREVVEHPGGVGIVPFYDNRIILIRQFRIAINEYVLEIPAGKLEGDEEPSERARRELEEETGYRARTMVSGGDYYASVGYTSEHYHVFLAFDLEHVGQALEEDERIEVVEIPIAEAREALQHNRYKDAKTVVGLLALFSHLDRL